MKVIHNNDIQQITFLDERFYATEDGGYFPSVTTILDVYPKGYGYHQWLKDLGSNAEEVMRRAADQGTHIHDGIAKFLNGGELAWTEQEKENYTLDEWLMLLKFVDFYKAYKPETIAIELSLVSPELGFGGTLDYVCKINGEVWYIDWKSGNGIYKTNKIQAAAYQKLWERWIQRKQAQEIGLPPITRMGCMHLRAATKGEDKKGKQIQGEGWKLDEVDEPERLWSLFKHAQEIWKEENPNPVPKNMVYPDRVSIELLSKEANANK